MLSGRYRTEFIARHWSTNRHGFCLSTTCSAIPESLEHILLSCTAYMTTRTKLTRLWLSSEDPNNTKLATWVFSLEWFSKFPDAISSWCLYTQHSYLSYTAWWSQPSLDKVWVFYSTHGKGRDPWEMGNSLAKILSFPCSWSLRA